jgi:hypothetical protein
MYLQIFSRLNSKYLRFVSLQGASRHAGIDVTLDTNSIFRKDGRRNFGAT